MEVLFDGDRVVRLRGNRDDVASHGFVCPKGASLKDLHHDPDRLRRPLVKRDGRFVEVDVDEAFAEIERRLLPIREAYGPASCGLVIGNPTVHRTGMVLYALDLAAALGSPNVFSAATLDQMPKHLAVGRLFGDFSSVPVPDIDRTDLLVVIGANPMVSNGSMWSVPDVPGRLDALRARGGRMVVIDPRRSETAARADRHLPIRPGADVWLLAAVAHHLAATDRIRLGRLQPFVSGLDEVLTALAPFAPDAVAARCGLDPDDIRQLAHDLADAPSAAIHGRLGTCTQRYGTAVSWLIDVLHVMSGNLDRPGGAMFATPPAFAGNTDGPPGRGAGIEIGRHRSRVSGLPEVMGQFPMACLAEEITTPGDGRIRALVTLAANPALSAPDSARTTHALEQLDCLVSFDVYLNETTRHADVIIPGRSPFAESHYDVFFSQYACRNTARFSPAIVDDDVLPADWQAMVRAIAILQGRGAAAHVDAVDDQLLRQLLTGVPAEYVDGIVAALGDRRGADRRLDLALRTGPYGDGFGARPDGLSLDRLVAHPNGIDLGPLVERLPDALRTASGTIELADADLLAELRRAADELGEPADRAEPADHADPPAGALTIIGRRQLRSNNSWMHNLPSLMRGRPRCTLEVHPDDAATAGLASGDLVAVTTTTGASITVPVDVTDAMRPGVVSLPHGWGHDVEGTRLRVACAAPGANLNLLTAAGDREHLTGTAVLGGIEVTLERR